MKEVEENYGTLKDNTVYLCDGTKKAYLSTKQPYDLLIFMRCHTAVNVFNRSISSISKFS